MDAQGRPGELRFSLESDHTVYVRKIFYAPIQVHFVLERALGWQLKSDFVNTNATLPVSTFLALGSTQGFKSAKTLGCLPANEMEWKLDVMARGTVEN